MGSSKFDVASWNVHVDVKGREQIEGTWVAPNGEATKLWIQVGASIGSGVSGSVYRGHRMRPCRDPHLPDTYAIKKIPLADIATPLGKRAHDLALTESTIMASCGHDRMVECFGVFAHDSNLYIIMEFLQGGTLFQLCKIRALTVEEAQFVITQIADVLSFLHKRRIVHRDLKLENILIGDSVGKVRKTREKVTGAPQRMNHGDMNFRRLFASGELRIFPQIKLSDFGLSHLPNEENNMPVSVVGTPTYIAPEIQDIYMKIRQGVEPREATAYGTAADIWSLGVVLYTLVRGEFPFPDWSYNTETLNMKGLDRSCADLIKRCFTINPEERITCHQIRRHRFLRKDLDRSLMPAHRKRRKGKSTARLDLASIKHMATPKMLKSLGLQESTTTIDGDTPTVHCHPLQTFPEDIHQLFEVTDDDNYTVAPLFIADKDLPSLSPGKVLAAARLQLFQFVEVLPDLGMAVKKHDEFLDACTGLKGFITLAPRSILLEIGVLYTISEMVEALEGQSQRYLDSLCDLMDGDKQPDVPSLESESFMNRMSQAVNSVNHLISVLQIERASLTAVVELSRELVIATHGNNPIETKRERTSSDDNINVGVKRRKVNTGDESWGEGGEPQPFSMDVIEIDPADVNPVSRLSEIERSSAETESWGSTNIDQFTVKNVIERIGECRRIVMGFGITYLTFYDIHIERFWRQVGESLKDATMWAAQLLKREPNSSNQIPKQAAEKLNLITMVLRVSALEYSISLQGSTANISKDFSILRRDVRSREQLREVHQPFDVSDEASYRCHSAYEEDDDDDGTTGVLVDASDVLLSDVE